VVRAWALAWAIREAKIEGKINLKAQRQMTIFPAQNCFYVCVSKIILIISQNVSKPNLFLLYLAEKF